MSKKTKLNGWNILRTRTLIKSKALWFAAEVIQEKISPEMSVEQVYETLKRMGQQELLEEQPERKVYVDKINKETNTSKKPCDNTTEAKEKENEHNG